MIKSPKSAALRSSLFALTALSGLAAMPNAASAAVVDFEDKAAFFCSSDATQSSGGLKYTTSFFVCYYSPSNPADFPRPLTSTVAANGFSDTTFSTLASTVFSLQSIDLAFGPFGHAGLITDTTTVTGNLAGGGTLSTVLTVGYGFQTFVLNYTNLTSITFSQLAGGSEYLAFDNIRFNGNAAVPEPAAWALMLAGFGLVGGAMRRRKPTMRVTYA